MSYTLPALPYAHDALEPYMDVRTLEIHHGKHHQTYVNNLNAAIEGTNLSEQPIEHWLANLDRVPEAIRTAVRNNGGGHANHSMFWSVMSPKGGTLASSCTLARAIDKDLGGLEAFKDAFTKAALTRFGSGWAWLSVTPQKTLVVESTANQDSPLSQGNTPILTLDVWEHAYYLHYQNRRPDFVAAFYNLINWDEVSRRYQEAMA